MLAKIQKILVIISIIALGIVMSMLIGAIFKLPVFKNNTLLALLLSLAVVAAGCFFANGALDLYKDKKVLSVMCLVLLSISALLGFMHFWSNFTLAEWFGRFTGIVVISSVLIVIIVTTNGALGKHFLPLQLVTYILVGLIDIVLIIALLGGDIFHGAFTTIFVISCIVAVTLLFVNKILGRRMEKMMLVEKIEAEENGDFVRITKEEYNNLLKQIDDLKHENEQLKANQ